MPTRTEADQSRPAGGGARSGRGLAGGSAGGSVSGDASLAER